jgi:hypothetical protein
MGADTGRRKLIRRKPQLAERRNPALFVVGANTVRRALLHLRHTSRRLLLRRRDGNSSQLLIYPNPVLRSQYLDVGPTTTRPTPQDYLVAFERTSLIGKVLKSRRAWSGRGRHIFETANNKTRRCTLGVLSRLGGKLF